MAQPTEQARLDAEPPAVELTNVTKKFGEVVAVDDLSLTVGNNRFFALLGPSGCGKTTTLRMIGGFEEPDRGVIKLHGDDVTGLKPYRRRVNTVFQSYALFPHMTIFDNVAFGLRRQNVEKGEVRQRVEEMLDLVQLPELGSRKPSQLSGGQQQRVALARALINRPRVLLLDEPLGALDLKLRKEMQIELKRIQHEVGIAFIHVTHDQEEAMTMADSVAVMNEGRIERLGAPAEIYDDPRSPFVASFLGASNLLAAEVAGAARGEVVLAGGTRVFVDPGALQGMGRKVLVGVRPEKLRVFAGSEESPTPNTLPGRVIDASFTGVSTQYLISTGGGEMTAVVQNVDARRFGEGEEVQVGWEPMHGFLVEPAPTEEG